MRYEDLCFDPVAYAKKLSAFLGLPYLKSVANFISEQTKGGPPDKVVGRKKANPKKEEEKGGGEDEKQRSKRSSSSSLFGLKQPKAKNGQRNLKKVN